MGRGMLLITTGLFVIFGIIQLSVYERHAQINAINVDYWNSSQARNIANAGIERAFYDFASNTSWRAALDDPELYMFGQDTAFVFVLDNSMSGVTLPQNIIEIRSIGSVNGITHEARAQIQISSAFPPIDGAMGIFTENLDFNIAGSAFLINGTDKNPDGTSGPVGSLPGIAVNNAPAYNEIMASLNNNQKGRIQGAEPDEESIESIGGSVNASHPSLNYNPSMDPEALEEFIALASANADHTYTNYTASGAGSLGTPANPKIIVVSGSLEVRNATGAGVIIITETGSLDARGNFDNYQGLIIVQGNADMTRGNIHIFGAMLFGGENPNLEIDIDFRGNVNVQYSSSALDNVNDQLFSSVGGNPVILTYVD
jgi:hypothetical protein